MKKNQRKWSHQLTVEIVSALAPLPALFLITSLSLPLRLTLLRSQRWRNLDAASASAARARRQAKTRAIIRCLLNPDSVRLLAPFFTDGRVHNLLDLFQCSGQLGSARLTHTALTRRRVFWVYPLECVESEKRKMRFISAKREKTLE
jgi:hypothetical protein